MTTTATGTNNGTAIATVAAAPASRSYADSKLTLPEIKSIATYAADSRYFAKATDVAQCFMKILAGQELGLSPTQALAYLHIVEGKPTMDATMVRARIRQHERYDYRIDRFDNEGATIVIIERGREMPPVTFEKDDAQRAGLLEKRGPWQTYPRAMYLARATTIAARTYAADVFNGPIYTPDEVGATIEMNEAGDILSVDTPAARAATAMQQVTPASAAPAADPAPIAEAAPIATATPASDAPPMKRKDLVRAIQAKLELRATSSLTGDDMLKIQTDIARVLGIEIRSLRDVTDAQLAAYLSLKDPFEGKEDAPEAENRPQAAPAVVDGQSDAPTPETAPDAKDGPKAADPAARTAGDTRQQNVTRVEELLARLGWNDDGGELQAIVADISATYDDEVSYEWRRLSTDGLAHLIVVLHQKTGGAA